MLKSTDLASQRNILIFHDPSLRLPSLFHQPNSNLQMVGPRMTLSTSGRMWELCSLQVGRQFLLLAPAVQETWVCQGGSRWPITATPTAMLLLPQVKQIVPSSLDIVLEICILQHFTKQKGRFAYNHGKLQKPTKTVYVQKLSIGLS